MSFVALALATPITAIASDPIQAEGNLQKVVTTEEGEKVLSFEKVYKIKVFRASWGKNCDGRRKRSLVAMPGMKTTHEVEEDNVLETVQELCDGKLDCTFTADSTTLKLDPAPSCRKYLTVFYRCFSYDHPRYDSIYEGRDATINCDVGDK